MIVALHGVPGLSFAELTYYLTELGIGFMAVNPKPVKVGGPSSKHVVPVVFNGAKALLENQKHIKFRCVAFVCDTFPRLHHELSWDCVGVEIKKSSHRYTQFAAAEIGKLIQEADKLKQAIVVPSDIELYDPTKLMIEKFSESSLSRSHTMMHRIKNQEMRAKTFAIVKGWFLGDIGSQDKLYTKLRAVHKNDDYLNKLLPVLTDKEGVKLRQVVIKGKANPNKIDALARKAGVASFDIRYLLSGKKK